MITYDTLSAMFNPKNKALVARLKKLNYTDEDLKDVYTFWEILRDCPKCRLKDKEYDYLLDQNMALVNDRKYFDGKFEEVKKSYK